MQTDSHDNAYTSHLTLSGPFARDSARDSESINRLRVGSSLSHCALQAAAGERRKSDGETLSVDSAAPRSSTRNCNCSCCSRRHSDSEDSRHERSENAPSLFPTDNAAFFLWSRA